MKEQSTHHSTLDGPLNGIVTDGAHGFWKSRKAILQVSSVYSISLDRWVPVIMSYMDGHSAQQFKIHFLSLFRGIADIIDSRGGDDLDTHLATVSKYYFFSGSNSPPLAGDGLQSSSTGRIYPRLHRSIHLTPR
jgi:hypothetical protein